MKYKIGDCILVNIETVPGKQKRVLVTEPLSTSVLSSESFQIVAKDEIMHTYKIIVGDDMLGWQISSFHIEHEGVAAAFRGKKFYDLHEQFVLGLK